MTTVQVDRGPFTDALDEAICEGAEALFTSQRADGVFDYSEDLTSTLGTVGALSALHYADPDGSADLIAAGAGWLRRTQNADGGWAMVSGLSSVEGWPSTLETGEILSVLCRLPGAKQAGPAAGLPVVLGPHASRERYEVKGTFRQHTWRKVPFTSYELDRLIREKGLPAVTFATGAES